MSETERAERLTRFLRLLPIEGGHELVILKGHLLIEEVLSDVCAESLRESNPLGIKVGERMMFAEKLRFAWALNSDGLDECVWRWLKELNQIRNKMAHTVEPVNIETRINRLSNEVNEFSKLSHMVPEKRELAFSLAWLYILLETLFNQLRKS